MPKMAYFNNSQLLLLVLLSSLAPLPWYQIYKMEGIDHLFWEALGFATEDRILKDLCEDSEALMDLLYTITLWLFWMSIPVVCFFEQYVTDYSARVGLS